VASIERELSVNGWASLPFNLPEREMAEYATSAREVIELAVSRPLINEALMFDLAQVVRNHRVVAGTFGLSRARTPGLDANKYTLQLGYQSRSHAGSLINEGRQPSVLRNFWELHEVILQATADSIQKLLIEELSASALAYELFPADLDRRNIHIRTNWYQQALIRDESAPREILSGHADRGVLTLHLFETHGGYLQGAPYQRAIALSDDKSIRRSEIARMLARLTPLTMRSEQSILFLGVGWWYLPLDLLPRRLAQLPVLYHVGRQPSMSASNEFPFAAAVANGKPDRLSVVAFIDPPLSLHKSGRYSVPPRRVARPALEE
jgi:hypothetical protein